MSTPFTRFRRHSLPVVDSTQRYIKDWHRAEPLPDGTLVWAHAQTAGYGRKSRPWVATPGESLTFSFVAYPTEPLPLWSARIAIALYETAALYTTIPLFLKWPNDLYAPQGKLAGILIEAQWQGEALSAVFVGIGLNVYQRHFEPDLWATSLAMLGANPPSLEHVLDTFEMQFITWLSPTPETLADAFLKRLWRKGPFKVHDREIAGEIVKWAPEGFLHVAGSSGVSCYEAHLVEMVWPPSSWPLT